MEAYKKMTDAEVKAETKAHAIESFGKNVLRRVMQEMKLEYISTNNELKLYAIIDKSAGLAFLDVIEMCDNRLNVDIAGADIPFFNTKLEYLAECVESEQLRKNLITWGYLKK